MAFNTRRPGRSRSIPGMLTLLIALTLVLTSSVNGAGWLRPPSNDAPVSNDTPEATAGETATALPPATHPARRQPVVVDSEEIPDGPIGVEDGYIPDGDVLSPWETDHPAIANLDSDLLDAVQRAATDARADGIELVVNSGWRSERYQQSLLDEAIVTYGSEEEARKWVNTPEQSTHVTGDGVDIAYTDADYWLIDHGNAYGLCQTYANEIWHFELAVEPGETCPSPLDDATASGFPRYGWRNDGYGIG